MNTTTVYAVRIGPRRYVAVHYDEPGNQYRTAEAAGSGWRFAPATRAGLRSVLQHCETYRSLREMREEYATNFHRTVVRSQLELA